jgi:hypothetical protein
MWRARFGRGFEPVVRQTAKSMNDDARTYEYQKPLFSSTLTEYKRHTTQMNEILYFQNPYSLQFSF